jgi:competence protein ComGC
MRIVLFIVIAVISVLCLFFMVKAIKRKILEYKIRKSAENFWNS